MPISAPLPQHLVHYFFLFSISRGENEGRRVVHWKEKPIPKEAVKTRTKIIYYRLFGDRLLSIQFMLWLSFKVTGRWSSNGDFGSLPNLSCVLLEKLLLGQQNMGYQGRAEQRTHDLIKIYGKPHRLRDHHYECSRLHLLAGGWEVCIWTQVAY